MTRPRTSLVSHSVFSEEVARDIPEVRNSQYYNEARKMKSKAPTEVVNFNETDGNQEESSFEENEFAAYSPEAAAFIQFASIDAIILASHEMATAKTTTNASSAKRHRIRFWHNKRIRSDSIRESLERPTKRHHVRRWLNKPREDLIDFWFVYENRNRVCAISDEAARIATIRSNAKAAARTGAMEAANVARMASVRLHSKRSIETGALETARVAKVVMVRLNARRAIQAGALEAAKLAQEKSVVHAMQSSVCDIDSFGEGGVGQDCSPIESKMFEEHPSQAARTFEDEDSSLDEDVKKEVNSRITLLYEQFEAVSPAFPELGPFIEPPSAVVSPAETQSAGKSEFECLNCISPREDLSSMTKSLFAESFQADHDNDNLNAGELTPLTENEGSGEKTPTASNTFGWFSKEPNTTDNIKNDPAPMVTSNFWKSLGKQVGLWKAKEVSGPALEVRSPFGDDQIGYAF